MELPKEIAAELTQAEQARARGNEGRARVCARRAAGLAARDYLIHKGIRPSTSSAMDLLNLLKSDPLLSSDLKLIADHLTVRVTEEFKLPIQVDLIAESRKFCDELLKQRP